MTEKTLLSTHQTGNNRGNPFVIKRRMIVGVEHVLYPMGYQDRSNGWNIGSISISLSRGSGLARNQCTINLKQVGWVQWKYLLSQSIIG